MSHSVTVLGTASGKTQSENGRMQLALMGYASDSDKLTFTNQGSLFSSTRTRADTKILLDQIEPTELVEDPGNGEKGEKEISTANISVSTTGVSTTEAVLKDESVQKKTKKQLEKERLSHEVAIRLQEQVNEEERQRIARDAKIVHISSNATPTAQIDKRKARIREIREVSGSVEEQSARKEKEVSEEELKKLLVIVQVEEVYIEALQVKYPIIDWEVFTEESRSY
ncbi:hypothetical protein Tco_0478978 [Tanacetum coccineum]